MRRLVVYNIRQFILAIRDVTFRYHRFRSIVLNIFIFILQSSCPARSFKQGHSLWYCTKLGASALPDHDYESTDLTKTLFSHILYPPNPKT